MKNGEIELLRFVFAMAVVGLHFNNRFAQINMFSNGRIGVEFFFLVTGVLLAKSVKKCRLRKR